MRTEARTAFDAWCALLSKRVPDTIARPMFEGWVWRRVGSRAVAASETLDAAGAAAGGDAGSGSGSGSGQAAAAASKKGGGGGSTRASGDDDEDAHSGEWTQRYAVLHLGVLYYFRDAESAVVFRRLAVRNDHDAVIGAAPIAEGAQQRSVFGGL